MDRVRRLKTVLWLFTGLAAAVATARFMFGLGSTTNLSDAVPWGLWKGFNVMSGVALAAGGFVITATVYIFKLEKFHSIVRLAVLTAFLGYIAAVVGLLFELGLPWDVWHMIIYWNPHSALFEVGWCVMLYLTVLTLEFFPVPTEDFKPLAKVRRFLVKIRLPLVIAGIALSTLHQSSLGSLFLITPFRLHPLWYSPILPIEFFVSAIGLGLMMVTFEILFTSHFYRRKPETGLLAQLGSAARWVFLLYLVMRFGDLAVRGKLGELAGGGWRVWIFWLEIAVTALIPMVLLFIPRVRRSHSGQWVVASIGVFGVVLNRINVGGFMHLSRGDFYLPAWTEIAISVGIVSAAMLVFMFMVEHFKVWEKRPADPAADPRRLPEFDEVGLTWLGSPATAARTRYSLAFIIAAGLGFAFLSNAPASSPRGAKPTPVVEARGYDTLWIDGNRDGYGVDFLHRVHQEHMGGEESCVKCHHMDFPRDRNTGCYRCHRDMYLPVDAFRHDWHASPDGGSVACWECHTRGLPRSGATAVKCEHCHHDLFPPDAQIKVRRFQAPGYAEALHRLCVGCHSQVAAAETKPDIARCATCHAERRNFVDTDIKSRRERLVGKRMVLPPIFRH